MKNVILALFITSLLAGCATPLNMSQKQELRGWQGKGLAVEESNPGTATALGLLPGGGSFYTGNIGTGVINLLFWPLSILWDTSSGYQGALANNYYATKTQIDRKKKKELDAVEDQLISGVIKNDEYIRQKRAVEEKYSFE